MSLHRVDFEMAHDATSHLGVKQLSFKVTQELDVSGVVSGDWLACGHFEGHTSVWVLFKQITWEYLTLHGGPV